MSSSDVKLQKQILVTMDEQCNLVSEQVRAAYRQLEVRFNLLNAQLDESTQIVARERRANAELTERLHLLLEALPTGVIELSSDKCVIMQNPAAVQMLGQSIVGQRWTDILATLTPLLGHHTFLAKSVNFEEKRQLTVQYKELRASNSCLVLLQDSTQLSQLSSALASQQRLVSLGSVVASLAHQLRTPLSTAILYVANLRQENLTAQERHRFIDKILARLNSLEGTIQNILSFVRGQVMQQEPLEIASIIEELKAVVLPQCQSRSVKLHCQLLTSSNVRVMGERKALVGALINLLENALYFSPVGGIISITVSEANGLLRVIVADEGPGVGVSGLDRLFEPFFTTRAGGTGLGLAIVKKVVEELGGNVCCSNKQSGGASFEVTLPISESPPPGNALTASVC